MIPNQFQHKEFRNLVNIILHYMLHCDLESDIDFHLRQVLFGVDTIFFFLKYNCI